jgi:hypothetical protein
MKIMKKLNYLFIILAIAGLSFLATSCGDTTEAEKPTITITSPTGDTLEYLAGDTIPFTVVLGTNNKELKTLKIELKKKDGALYATSGVDSTLEKGKTNITINIGIILPSLINAGDILEITFTVTDAEPLSNSTVKYIKIKSPYGNIKSFTAILMGGADNANVGSFLDASEGTVYKLAEAKTNSSKVDIIFTYSSTNANLLAAPNDATIETAFGANTISTWTTRNATKFYGIVTGITKAQFEAISNDGLIVEKVKGTAATRVNQLKVDDIVAVETADSKKALIHVAAIGGTTGADRTITLDVKIQK